MMQTIDRCVQCRTRQRVTRRAQCHPCCNANDALAKYWRDHGMCIAFEKPRYSLGIENRRASHKQPHRIRDCTVCGVRPVHRGRSYCRECDTLMLAYSRYWRTTKVAA
jgi:hypothetical protein